MGGFDDLNVDAGAEWLEVGYDELLVCRRSGCWQELSELGEAKSGEHGCEIGIVGKVEVEGLVEGECGCVVVQSDIDLSRGRIQGVVGHSCQEFFDISYAHCPARW